MDMLPRTGCEFLLFTESRRRISHRRAPLWLDGCEPNRRPGWKNYDLENHHRIDTPTLTDYNCTNESIEGVDQPALQMAVVNAVACVAMELEVTALQCLSTARCDIGSTRQSPVAPCWCTER
jgi:hypothetical protein